MPSPIKSPSLFFDYIAQMDSNAKLDAPLGWNARIALDHAVLHLDGAAHRVDNAAEFNDGSIAGALDHPPIVDGDYRVDQIAPKCPQPRQYAILVRAGKSAIPDHIRH
jgi:hypothetical protein